MTVAGGANVGIVFVGGLVASAFAVLALAGGEFGKLGRYRLGQRKEVGQVGVWVGSHASGSRQLRHDQSA